MAVKRRRNEGALAMETVVILVLLAAFLFVAFLAVIKPLFSREFHLSLEDRVCQITVALNRQFFFPVLNKGLFPVVCSTQRLLVDKARITKAMKSDDTFEDGAMRFVLDSVRRCKFLAGGDAKTALFRARECYICYTLETESDVPPVPVQDFVIFSWTKKTEKGQSYLVDLQSQGLSDHPHAFVLQTDAFLPNKKYAVVYVDQRIPASWVLWAKPLAGCVVGGKVGGLAGTVVPGAGTLSGAAIGCVVGAVGGGSSSLYDLAGEETNKILFTDLKNLEAPERSACGGFAF